MSLLRVWNERKEVSPHRPKRARTGRLVLGLIGVIVFFWILSQVS